MAQEITRQYMVLFVTLEEVVKEFLAENQLVSKSYQFMESHRFKKVSESFFSQIKTLSFSQNRYSASHVFDVRIEVKFFLLK